MNDEINLFELWDIFRKYLVKIILAAIIGSILAFLFMFLLVDSEYQSEAQLLVNQQRNETTIQTGDIQANVQLIDTYRDIILGEHVLEDVSTSLGGQYELGALRSRIKVTQAGNSQGFHITATMGTPEEAQSVVENVISSFEVILNEIYPDEITGVFVLYSPTYNASRTSPSLSQYILIGAVLGIMVSVGVILVKEMLDTNVKKPSDLQKLGLIPLGVINTMTGENSFYQENTPRSSRRV